MKKERISRREFLGSIAATSCLPGLAERSTSLPTNDLRASHQRQRASSSPIDRAALVRRHNPVLRRIDPLSPLSIGNGEFAFTADITGLQTFPAAYEKAMPLCTMSQWGWHSSPLNGLNPSRLRLTGYDTHGRSVGYATSSEGQIELFNWLRENPHRLHLGRIGFKLTSANGREAQPSDITDAEQTLDLWTAAITSRFRFEGKAVTVKTSVHPGLDLLAVTIESELIEAGRLAVVFQFPYGSPSMNAADWTRPGKHQTTSVAESTARVILKRSLDEDQYSVVIGWDGEASLSGSKAHTFELTPSRKQNRLEFVAAFSPNVLTGALPRATATHAASELHWRRFWNEGAAIELAGSRDIRAQNLERRVVLSQYLTAIQCAGSQPPQETGLTVNSWYGKFHLEMHWWHAAHFATWNRLPLLEKSLGWYETILPTARELARRQGYDGARWPKMVGPEGRDSPSPIGPLLIWQQPHPIAYAELCYLVRRDKATLNRYRQLVFETAEFMASFAFFDQGSNRYLLGPPVIPAQENHPPRETWNPTFELAYWSHGLEIAQRWRERLGMPRSARWDRVISQLSALPARDGVFLAHENCPQTFSERNRDHPSMLAAFGVLPGAGVDRDIMRRTLQRVLKEWKWETTWGWDYPMTAMTAARLGEPKLAIDALLMATEKNRYLPNGHNWQRENLPCYLPGNGGLLYAVAMMAGGWSGAPQAHAPGFPNDGSWSVRAEGLNSSLLERI
jgi:hypothetical protein